MGWSFSCNRGHGRKELIAELRAPGRWCEGGKMLRSSVVGNHHWYVVEVNGGRRFIGLDLMAGGGKDSGWGYKGLSESCGPSAIDCPVSFFADVSVPEGDYAKGWREKVIANQAAQKAKKQALVAGSVVRYGEHEYRLVCPVAPRKGWQVLRVSDGQAFRMQAQQLSRAALV